MLRFSLILVFSRVASVLTFDLPSLIIQESKVCLDELPQSSGADARGGVTVMRERGRADATQSSLTFDLRPSLNAEGKSSEIFVVLS